MNYDTVVAVWQAAVVPFGLVLIVLLVVLGIRRVK